MKSSKWARRLSCAALTAAVVAGAAIAAGSQGSQDDPLVTLSYLNDVAAPEIMKQVDKLAGEKAEAIAKQWEEEGRTVFRTVELKKGKTLTLSAGCQVLVRSGTMTSPDALVDLTAGETWTADGSLHANHLYIATGDKQTLTASDAAVILVQGIYQTK